MLRAASSDGAETDLHNAFSVDRLTTLGTAMGMISYLLPERVRGNALDHRTDLFSFGVVMYEMATGSQLFTGETSAVVFAKSHCRVSDERPTPGGHRPFVPVPQAASIVPTIVVGIDGNIQPSPTFA